MATLKKFSENDLYVNEDTLMVDEMTVERVKNYVVDYERSVFLAVIEFLTLYYDPNEVKNQTFVYVGKDALEFIKLVYLCYPQLYYVVYYMGDKKLPNKESWENIEYYEDFNNMEIKKYKNKNILFFSDFRSVKYEDIYKKMMVISGVDEQEEGKLTDQKYKEFITEVNKKHQKYVYEDLNIQKGWLREISPLHSFIKFCLPFYKPSFVEYTNTSQFKYIKGMVFYKLYNPIYDFETYLKPINDLSEDNYDLLTYNKIMFHHTLLRKDKTYMNPFNVKIDETIDYGELILDYDSLAEYEILKLYLKKHGTDITLPHGIIDLSSTITRNIGSKFLYQRRQNANEDIHMYKINACMYLTNIESFIPDKLSVNSGKLIEKDEQITVDKEKRSKPRSLKISQKRKTTTKK